MSIAFQYWYLMQGEGLPAGAIAYKNRVEADGGTTTSLGCVPNEIWARYSDSPAAIDIVQLYLNRVAADGGTALLSKAEIEALLPPDWQNASFLNIPSARKAGTLYSIIGSDFTTTRLSVANEFNSSSQFASLAPSIPRINFLNGYSGYLSESERVNLKPRSLDWSNSNFILNNVTQSQSTALAPFNEAALQVRETATTAAHSIQIQPDASLVSTNIYTRTYYFEPVGREVFQFGDSGQGGSDARINVITNTVISLGGNIISAKSEPFGDIYKVTVVFTATGPIGRVNISIFEDNTTASYLGDTTKGYNLYHVQYELGSYGTSPIITEGVAVTRIKDLATLTGAGAQIGELDSTVFVKFNASNFGELRTALTIDGVEGSLKFQKLANNDISVVLLNGATTVFSIVISGSLTGVQKFAVAYSNAGYISSLNGATGASGTLGDTQPPLTDITLGADSDNTLHWNDTVATVALWKVAKDQTQINEMTA